MTSQHFVLSLKDEQGALHLPLMRPTCPQNIWKARAPPTRSLLILMTFFCVPASNKCGCDSVFFSLANTHFTHNPWHFLSSSHVSDLIGCHINNNRAHSARCGHVADASRTAALTDYLVPFGPPQLAAAVIGGVEGSRVWGFVNTRAPGVDPEGSAARTHSLPVDGLIEHYRKIMN